RGINTIFTEVDFGGEVARTTRQFVVKPPPGARSDSTSLTISPQGDRVAWAFETDSVPSWSSWLHKIFPSYRVTSHHVCELWVSRLDGNDMHEVGHLELNPQTSIPQSSMAVARQLLTYALQDHPDQIRWLPDGKRLSFLYKDALYTVPAD